MKKRTEKGVEEIMQNHSEALQRALESMPPPEHLGAPKCTCGKESPGLPCWLHTPIC